MNKCVLSGVCCRLFYINLNKEEYNSGKFKTELEKFGHIKDFKKAEACGANILKKKKDGSCIYLKNNMCSIHATRPKVCRGFFCTSKRAQYKDMVAQVKKVKKEKNIL